MCLWQRERSKKNNSVKILRNETINFLKQVSIAVHEMLHALGAWHEMQRSDRDGYVTIISQNLVYM